MADPGTTVFIIDDDAPVRLSLNRLLRAAGFQAEALGSAEEFLARKPYRTAGCLLLDVSMPGLTGVKLQAHLKEIEEEIPIVFLTGHGDIPTSVQAMKLGAVDFLTKPVDETLLLASVRQALVLREKMVTERREAEVVRGCVATLTERELEVMEYVISGALNKQIAAQLGTVEKTVKVHRGRLMEKMGVKSVAELVRLCSQVGIQPKTPA